MASSPREVSHRNIAKAKEKLVARKMSGESCMIEVAAGAGGMLEEEGDRLSDNSQDVL